MNYKNYQELSVHCLFDGDGGVGGGGGLGDGLGGTCNPLCKSSQIVT